MSERKAPGPEHVVRVLRHVDLFSMLSDEDLQRVAATGEVRTLERGEVLFVAGDAADRIHILLQGVLEIVRTSPDQPEPQPVAYLSPGETIGDMAMFTGRARRSTGRVPESLGVFTLTRDQFESLARSIGGYGMQVATMFAKRLEEFINHMRGQARRKELSGQLRFFDLPTIVQTLVTSRQTGVLTLTAGGNTWAEVLLRDGAVEQARCGLLEGDEAFFELFLGEPDGEFFFRGLTDPAPDRISRVPITMSAMNLLMESMRLVDELPAVRQRLPDPDRAYQARTDDLRWDDEATVRAAHDVLARLRTPRRIGDLIGQVPCSTYTLYEIAADLIETGQIA